MNKNKRNKNRANAKKLRIIAKRIELENHTCENCGEKGGHWIQVRGQSLEGLILGIDDQEGFWTCAKMYGADGRRLL
jgi:hypothetical protein